MGECGTLFVRAAGLGLGPVCTPAAVGHSVMARLAAYGQTLTVGVLAAIGPMQCAIEQPMGTRRFDQLLCPSPMGTSGHDRTGCSCGMGSQANNSATLAGAVAAATREAACKSTALGKRGKGSLDRSPSRGSARSGPRTTAPSGCKSRTESGLPGGGWIRGCSFESWCRRLLRGAPAT